MDWQKRAERAEQALTNMRQALASDVERLSGLLELYPGTYTTQYSALQHHLQLHDDAISALNSPIGVIETVGVQHEVFVLHSPYPDGSWRGIEKCATTEYSDGPLLFYTEHEILDFMKKRANRIDPDFRIVPVVLTTPSVREDLKSYKSLHERRLEQSENKSFKLEIGDWVATFHDPTGKEEARCWIEKVYDDGTREKIEKHPLAYIWETSTGTYNGFVSMPDPLRKLYAVEKATPAQTSWSIENQSSLALAKSKLNSACENMLRMSTDAMARVVGE